MNQLRPNERPVTGSRQKRESRTFCLIAMIFLTFTSMPVYAGLFGPNWTVYNDVSYGPSPDEKADLYLFSARSNPVILFVHGGGWTAGDKSIYAGWYANLYGNAGFSVISINYRLASISDPTTQWPAQLQDVQLAIRWIRHYASTLNIDPQRITVFGDSAGAQLALFAGNLQNSVPGDRSNLFADESPMAEMVVDMFGPTDLTDPNFVGSINGSPLFGGQTYAQAPSLYQNASPINVISAVSPPTVIIQGSTDTIVPAAQSINLFYKLLSFGKDVTWLPYVGGHWFDGINPSSAKTDIDNKALDAVSNVMHPCPFSF